MLICEMAAYFKKQGKSLAQVIDGIYEEYGYYKNTTLSYEFDGAVGMQKMADIMSDLRKTMPTIISDYKVVKTADYNLSVEKDLKNNTETVIDLPKSNVIQFNLEGNNAVIVRPSGTEPKIKLYITAVGKDKTEAKNITDKLAKAMENDLGLK